MNFLDFLDRIGQRKMERYRLSPPKAHDPRLKVGVSFFVGYYVLIFAIMFKNGLGVENAGLVKDAMLVLGPIVGMIAQALFRSDARSDQDSVNNGEAMKLAREAVQAAPVTPKVDI